MGIAVEVVLILILVLANGLFSMAEMAVVSSRKSRLRQRSEEGSHRAALALQLAESPNDFLSTVQVGITLIGTLAGAFGGATIAEEFAAYLRQFPVVAPYSESIGIGSVVLGITYLSLILGELVPKNIALGSPESIAAAVAPPMRLLARIGSPVVRFLTFSTQIVMKALPIKKRGEAPVTEEEIKVLIAQGTQHGTFEEAEQEMVEGVFRLGDRRVTELMRPRRSVTWLDVEDSWAVNEKRISESIFSRFLVAEGDLDHLIGMVHVKDLFVASRGGQAVELRVLARKPLFVPETKPALEVLELFQQTREELAVIIDEHGAIEGIVTLADLVHAIIGDLPLLEAETRSPIVPREDGSWLVDGSVNIPDLLDALSWRAMPGEESGFTTLGGSSWLTSTGFRLQATISQSMAGDSKSSTWMAIAWIKC
jgi:putative hemolysin